MPDQLAAATDNDLSHSQTRRVRFVEEVDLTRQFQPIACLDEITVYEQGRPAVVFQFNGQVNCVKISSDPFLEDGGGMIIVAIDMEEVRINTVLCQ